MQITIKPTTALIAYASGYKKDRIGRNIPEGTQLHDIVDFSDVWDEVASTFGEVQRPWFFQAWIENMDSTLAGPVSPRIFELYKDNICVGFVVAL